MDDGADLLLVQRAARVQVQQHRRGRLLLLAHEHGVLRHGQVDARGLHRGDGLDGAGHLAFQRALEVHLLEKLRHAQLLVFHQLETDAAALGQALGSQLQAHVVDLFGRHQDGDAAIRIFVRHVELLQRGDDGAAVLVGEVGEQHLVFRLLAPHPQARHDRHHRRRADGGQ
jgi:hypothetical protein